MPIRTLTATACLALLPTLATAQDTAQQHVFTALPAPAERPYPYEILGMQPGDALDDVMAILTPRSETAPTNKTDVFAVQSPDGRTLEFTYELLREIGALSLNDNLANVNFPEHMRVFLASTVLEQRAVILDRSMRLPTEELPTAQALQAQMEAAYGTPTKIETTRGNVTLTYAWSDEGFIPDLAAQTSHPITFTERDGREITSTYQPCVANTDKRMNDVTEYFFQYPRPAITATGPTCVAIFTISHTTKPGTTAISFKLTDYDLARQNRDELDRQIIEALTGETTTAPSKMEL